MDDAERVKCGRLTRFFGDTDLKMGVNTPMDVINAMVAPSPTRYAKSASSSKVVPESAIFEEIESEISTDFGNADRAHQSMTDNITWTPSTVRPSAETPSSVGRGSATTRAASIQTAGSSVIKTARFQPDSEDFHILQRSLLLKRDGRVPVAMLLKDKSPQSPGVAIFASLPLPNSSVDESFIRAVVASIERAKEKVGHLLSAIAEVVLLAVPVFVESDSGKALFCDDTVYAKDVVSHYLEEEEKAILGAVTPLLCPKELSVLTDAAIGAFNAFAYTTQKGTNKPAAWRDSPLINQMADDATLRFNLVLQAVVREVLYFNRLPAAASDAE